VSARYEFIDGEKATLDAVGEKRYSVVKMCEWYSTLCSAFGTREVCISGAGSYVIQVAPCKG
jgi:hypothetical protein